MVSQQIDRFSATRRWVVYTAMCTPLCQYYLCTATPWSRTASSDVEPWHSLIRHDVSLIGAVLPVTICLHEFRRIFNCSTINDISRSLPLPKISSITWKPHILFALLQVRGYMEVLRYETFKLKYPDPMPVFSQLCMSYELIHLRAILLSILRE